MSYLRVWTERLELLGKGIVCSDRVLLRAGLRRTIQGVWRKGSRSVGQASKGEAILGLNYSDKVDTFYGYG